MISKTVLSTAVTLALSAGFVSAQSISANGTFDSNFSQDCTIAENVSNLVFDITPGKVPPTNADKSSMHSATKMQSLRWLSRY